MDIYQFIRFICIQWNTRCTDSTIVRSHCISSPLPLLPINSVLSTSPTTHDVIVYHTNSGTGADLY